MPGITIGFGAVLCAIGLWGFFGSDPDKQSVTALIPAFFGAALIVCGLLAFAKKWRKHAMHAAAGIGLLGFLAAAGCRNSATRSPMTPRFIAPRDWCC